jgi:uncharacterized repeat protein (TIGR01451 family)
VLNEVQLAYTVGGVSQTQIDANDTDGFLVDKIIDFTLTHDDTPRHLVVTPGATDQVRQFTLTNTGNAVQDFTLLATNLTGSEVLDGKTDTDDATNFEYSLDNSTWNSTPPTIDDLAADTNVTIYVRSDIPAAPTAVNGDIINIQLEATAVKDGTTEIEVATGGADDKDSVDTVLGEGIGVTTEGNSASPDAQFSAWAGYEVQSASLTVTKTSCVIWDPVKASNGDQKRIPGAVVRYAIQVANTGSQDATSVVLTDALNTNLTYGTTAPAPTAVALISTEACNCASPGTANNGTVVESGGTVTATYESPISAAETQCAYFDVTIQ